MEDGGREVEKREEGGGEKHFSLGEATEATLCQIWEGEVSLGLAGRNLFLYLNTS